MNFTVIGIHPEAIVNHLLHEYDEQSSAQAKANFLKNNRPLPQLKSAETAKDFSSGNTIDLNPGELLGLGMVGIYYNVAGEKTDNTYQVITGVQDTHKSYTEALLSDGAIWHDQTGKKMLFQTTMAQGYVPKKTITAKDVAERVNQKVARRGDYDKTCGLIVNVFTGSFTINPEELAKLTDLSAYTETYLVLYDLPSLSHANVIRISHPGSPELPIKLQRHPREDIWHLNEAGV